MQFDDPMLASDADRAAPDAAAVGGDTLPIDDLLDELVTVHHPRLRGQVARIDQIAREMAAHGDAANDGRLAEIRQLIESLSACVDSQLISEEQVLFPMLRRLQRPTQITACRAGMIQSRLLIAEREFARLRGVTLRLRDLTREYTAPAGPCDATLEMQREIDTLLRDLRDHADKEIRVVYRWAAARERQLSN
jgi:iron-sulfur cluster repair protein YtfE (RIC family)